MYSYLGMPNYTGTMPDTNSYPGPYTAGTTASAPAASSWGWNNLVGAGVSGLSSYFQQQAAQKAQAEQAKLSVEGQKAMLEQKRNYALEDRKSHQAAAGRWSKYFGGT